MSKVSLHKILEETLGLSKIKSKEELRALLKDEERMEEAARAIREAGKSNELSK